MDIVNKYIITNDESYVSNQNATGVTPNKDNAYMWSSSLSAENVLKCAKERKGSSGVIVLSNDYYVKEIHLYETALDEDIVMDTRTISDFLDIVVYCAEERDTFAKELSTIDRKLSDINHFIEFQNLNAVDGFKIYKKIQELRQRRRYVKNRLKMADDINSQSIDPEVLKKILKYFKDLCYKPREIDFEDMLK